MSFAEKLKQLRLQNNLTQEALGKRMNVSRSTIAGYETKNRQPSYEKLTALASLFRVPVDYLLDEDLCPAPEFLPAPIPLSSPDTADFLPVPKRKCWIFSSSLNSATGKSTEIYPYSFTNL